MIQFIQALVALSIRVAPDIYDAIRNGDDDLAKRRAREAYDRFVAVSCQKERLKKELKSREKH